MDRWLDIVGSPKCGTWPMGKRNASVVPAPLPRGGAADFVRLLGRRLSDETRRSRRGGEAQLLDAPIERRARDAELRGGGAHFAVALVQGALDGAALGL